MFCSQQVGTFCSNCNDTNKMNNKSQETIMNNSLSETDGGGGGYSPKNQSENTTSIFIYSLKKLLLF